MSSFNSLDNVQTRTFLGRDKNHNSLGLMYLDSKQRLLILKKRSEFIKNENSKRRLISNRKK